jgi:hypothetical protein
MFSEECGSTSARQEFQCTKNLVEHWRNQKEELDNMKSLDISFSWTIELEVFKL